MNRFLIKVTKINEQFVRLDYRLIPPRKWNDVYLDENGPQESEWEVQYSTKLEKHRVCW